jgi:hypothetical protein
MFYFEKSSNLCLKSLINCQLQENNLFTFLKADIPIIIKSNQGKCDEVDRK